MSNMPCSINMLKKLQMTMYDKMLGEEAFLNQGHIVIFKY